MPSISEIAESLGKYIQSRRNRDKPPERNIRIKSTSKRAPRIVDTSPRAPTIPPEEIIKGLGAEPPPTDSEK